MLSLAICNYNNSDKNRSFSKLGSLKQKEQGNNGKQIAQKSDFICQTNSGATPINSVTIVTHVIKRLKDVKDGLIDVSSDLDAKLEIEMIP